MSDPKDFNPMTGIHLPFKFTDLPQWLQDMMHPVPPLEFEVRQIPRLVKAMRRVVGTRRSRQVVGLVNKLGALLVSPAAALQTSREPLWDIYPGPEVCLTDIRERRFDIIERSQSLAKVAIQEAGDEEKVFQALSKVGEAAEGRKFGGPPN